MDKYVVVISTAGSKEEAEKLASALVSAKKAACVQMIPMQSCYSWEGKINNDPEILLLIKTRKVLFKDVEGILKKEHSYTVPEVVCLDIVDGSNEYLSWITSVT